MTSIFFLSIKSPGESISESTKNVFTASQEKPCSVASFPARITDLEWHQLLLPDKTQQHFSLCAMLGAACTQRGILHLWECGALAQQGGTGPKHLG